MLTEKELEAAIDVILDRLDEVNSLFIKKVAEQIKKIGELGQANINGLVLMADMGADVHEINQKLTDATGLNIRDLYKIYAAAMQDTYTDPRFNVILEDAQTIADGAKPSTPPTVPTASQSVPQGAESVSNAPHTVSNNTKSVIKARLTQYTRAIAEQTANTMKNLSNTTAIQDTYKEAVDSAVAAVASGLTDYTSATREIIRSLGSNGIKVEYESGYRRGLDTAVRQNIVDGANQIAQNGAKIIGDELGYDAYEISAHANSAKDHEPVQGRVFLRAEFDKMQTGTDFTGVDGKHYSGFPRPIGEWNCGHIAVPFDTKHSVRRYTDEQLAQWEAENNQGCEIDGKHYSTYQASQLMRKIETEVRRCKDTANAAKAAGDDTLRQECQKKINILGSKYSQIAKTAGLPTKRERMAVEGFRAVKLKKQES